MTAWERQVDELIYGKCTNRELQQHHRRCSSLGFSFAMLCYSIVIPTSNVIKGLKKAFLSFKYGWFSHIQRIQHVASVFPQRP